jgi:putative FmdB family regulatory protein
MVLKENIDEEMNTHWKEETMPSYEFLCEKCKNQYTLQLSLAEYEKKKYACPKCKSRKVKQQITTFQTQTSRKS